MKPHVSKRARAEAVKRIRAGVSDAGTEAQKLNVHKRNVQKWVSATEEALKAGGDAGNDMSQITTPSEKAPDSTRNEALDEALKAAGEQPEGPRSTGPTSADVQEARLDVQGQCLQMVGDLKQAVGSVLVQFRYDPPLKVTDPKVQEKLQLGPLAAAAIRSNAEKLYPILTGMLSGRFQLFAALGMEALLLLVGLEKLAKGEGWEAPAKRQAPPPSKLKPAVGGSPADLAEQIDRARKEQIPTGNAPGTVPINEGPVAGTINAPAA